MTDGLVTPDPPAGPFQDVGRRQHRKRKQQRWVMGVRTRPGINRGHITHDLSEAALPRKRHSSPTTAIPKLVHGISSLQDTSGTLSWWIQQRKQTEPVCSDSPHQTWWQVFCCHICFYPQVCGTAHGLSAFKMYLNVCFYIFNALTPANNGRYTAVKWSFFKCTTLLRRRSVLRFLSNIPKTCFIPEKQNTINNIIPVSGTRHGHLMCGFVLSVLCECFCCANGAAVCYWEEGFEYMRQKNTTHPPWALLNINTRQHSKNIQRDTPMYGRKEVTAVAWNAGILQTPDLVDRDEMSRTVKSGSYKIPHCFCCWKIVYAAIVHWEHRNGAHVCRPSGPRDPPPSSSVIKGGTLKTH